MYRIKKFKVMKVALFAGFYGVFIGLLFGILMTLSSFFVPVVFPVPGILDFATGAFAIVIFPLFYGVLAFIGGLIFTPLMNLTLKMIKGVDFELEAVAVNQEVSAPVNPPGSKYVPPPAHQPGSGYI